MRVCEPAAARDHPESLKRDLPSFRSFEVFGGGETGYQAPCEADDLEAGAIKVV